LSSQRLDQPSDRWGANEKQGRKLVCCGFRVPWFLFRQFEGEESVVLSFDAAALSALPSAIFSPYNTARREATQYLEREIEVSTALEECLEKGSAAVVPEFLAPEIPLSALRFVVFCDEEAREAWKPVIEGAMGHTVPNSVGILVDGELDQVRFPPGLSVTKRIRPLKPGINHRGEVPNVPLPDTVNSSISPEEISSDFWILSEAPSPVALINYLTGWRQAQRSETVKGKRDVGQQRWVEARKKVRERVAKSGLEGLRERADKLEANAEAFRYRLEARRFLVDQDRSPYRLVKLAREFRRAANELGRGPGASNRIECLEQALGIYREALRIDNSAASQRYALVGAAAVLADMGNYEKAFECCSVVLADFPEDAAAQEVMGRVETPWDSD